MKSGAGQLFPVLLLGLLAALSFWLQGVVDREMPASRPAGAQRLDATAEHFSILRLDDQGKPRYRLIAPYLAHYPDDDATLVTFPTVLNYREAEDPVVISAHEAVIAVGGDVVHLWGGVVAQRGATAKAPQLVAQMPDLTLQTQDKYAFTASPVEINQGNAWLKGIGLRMDHAASQLFLDAAVRGYYLRPRGKQ